MKPWVANSLFFGFLGIICIGLFYAGYKERQWCKQDYIIAIDVDTGRQTQVTIQN